MISNFARTTYRARAGRTCLRMKCLSSMCVGSCASNKKAISLFMKAIFSLFIFSIASNAQVLNIAPGRPSTFEISVPAIARAGEPVTLKIEVRDAQGNLVTDYDRIGGGISLQTISGSERSAGIEPNRFPASAFRAGILSAQVVLTKSGTMELDVADPILRVSSRTGRIDVSPGKVSTIRVTAPNEVRVSNPFDIVVELYDAYGNSVADYDRYGSEVVIKPGTVGAIGRFEPERISPSYFSKGRASVKVRYTQAERTSILCASGSASGVSREFDVRAGELHTFAVSIPSRPISAGEPFSIMIEAKDQNGNTILDYNRFGGVVELKTSGTGMLEPATVPPTAFNAGIAMVNVRYNVAERITVIAQDAGGAKRGESREKVEITGGRLGRFDVIPAERGRAGEPIAVQIIGYDLYGNIIRDYGNRNMRAVLTSADASLISAPTLNSESFSDGVAFISVTPERAGQLVLQVIDEVTGAGGRSNPVQIKSGCVASYSIKTATIAIAHEPFEVEITALDRFGNIVEDYQRTGNGIVVKSSGQGDFAPASIPPSSFENGIAKVKFTYNTAEEIKITLSEQGGVAEGQSGNVLVTHAAPKIFGLELPSSATAGEPVKIKIKVLDEFGNPVVAYSALNRSISLYMENGEPMTPQLVSSSLFQNGTAEISATFIRTGDAVLFAEEVGGRVTGKSDLIRILPSRPAKILVSSPLTAEVGIPMTLRIEMRDKLNNRIRDYSPPATSLTLRALDSHGGIVNDAVELGNIAQMRFREGIAEVSVLPKKSGKIIFEVKDEVLRINGKFGVLDISAGPVDHFKVESLMQNGMKAGEPMKMRITALDAFDNQVANFGRDGSGVRLFASVGTRYVVSMPASGVFLPSTLRGSLFQDGQAVIYAIYDKAEAVEVGVDRIAAGTLSRPEVVSALANEQGGGTIISVMLNSETPKFDISRVTESIFEMVIPGAILSSAGPRIVKSSGIVSLVAMNQDEFGVRVLVHTSAPATVRSAEDANRILLSVDPVLNAAPVGIFAPPTSSTTPSINQPASNRPSTASLPTMSDIDKLVKENRFGEALQLVNIMLGAYPQDASLLNLKRRLELILPYQQNIQSAPQQQYGIQSSFPALQTPSLPIQNRIESGEPSISSAETEIRAGRYDSALRILDSYLEAHPGDENAVRMKQRIEQLMNLMRRGK